MFTRYGRRELLVGFVVLGSLAAVCAAWLPWATPLPAALFGFVLWFMRDPPRRVPEGEDDLVAPADGKVIAIDEMFENDYLKENAVRISIFLSGFNVHLNRAPYRGLVEYVNYSPGKYHPAWGEDASRDNERNSIGIAAEGPCGRVLVRQIAGIMARRIVCEADVGDILAKGQRFGMIKLGSRTELFIPRSAGLSPTVAVGDKVMAGETIVCVRRTQ